MSAMTEKDRIQYEHVAVNCKSFLSYLRKSVQITEKEKRQDVNYNRISFFRNESEQSLNLIALFANVKHKGCCDLAKKAHRVHKSANDTIKKMSGSNFPVAKLTRKMMLPKVLRFINLALDSDAFSRMKAKVNPDDPAISYKDVEVDIMSASIKPQSQTHALGYLDRTASASGKCYDCKHEGRSRDLIVCCQCYHVEKQNIWALADSVDRATKVESLTKHAKSANCLFFCLTCSDNRHKSPSLKRV